MTKKAKSGSKVIIVKVPNAGGVSWRKRHAHPLRVKALAPSHQDKLAPSKISWHPKPPQGHMGVSGAVS